MTDYRRPDLDLWEEEDDVEDARPTIVAERPKNQPPELPEEATNARLRPVKESTARITTGPSAKVIPPGDETTSVRMPPLPTVARGALPPMRPPTTPFALPTPAAVARADKSAPSKLPVAEPTASTLARADKSAPKKLPERELPPAAFARADKSAPSKLPTPEATLESLDRAEDAVAKSEERGASTHDQERAPRESGEVLRNSEISALQVADEKHDEDAKAELSAQDEGEVVSGDEVEEVVTAKKVEPAFPMPLPVPRDRDVTERISFPAVQESIAPTAHTVPPKQREKRELGAWQLGVAALALIAGGLGVSTLRKALDGSDAVAISAQREATTRGAANVEAKPQAASQPVRAPEPAETTMSSSQPEQEEHAPEPVAAAEPVAPGPLPVPPSQPAAVPVKTQASAEKGAVAKAEPRRARVAPATTAAEASESEEESAEEQPAATKEGGLPAKPSREQVSEVLNALVPELQKCVGDRGGDAEVTLTVRSAGLVSYSVVGGQYAGTPEGSCIARAVKAAKFPAFSEPTLRITYPFRL